MSYGQYSRTGDRLAYEREVGYREPKKDGGYPVPREDVKSGRMTKAEIMADIDESEVVESKKTAHNEITRKLRNGAIICRLRETDIVTLWPDGGYRVNTGGWNTPTTRRHVMDFLSRHKIPATLWGDKKAGGNLLRDLRGNTAREIKFREYVTVFADGSYTADAPVWQYDGADNRSEPEAYS